jgi:iron complex transport system permease protein
MSAAGRGSTGCCGARLTLLLGALALASLAGALLIGPFPASPWEVLRALRPGGGAGSPLETAIRSVRLPRVVLAFLVGMALSASGTAYQSVFRNPLVSAHVLGVASGASLGAAAALMLSAPAWAVQLAALAGGLLAVALVLGASRLVGDATPLSLVLVGLITGSFCSALVSLMTYLANPDQKLPAIVFWLMGSLAAAGPRTLILAGPPIVAGLAVLLAMRWELNLLALGEEEARALGLEPAFWRRLVILACTLMTAAAVCACGVVGWVGLVVPHAGRLLAGADHRRLLPATVLLGGIFLLGVDACARTLTTAEIPLGIITGLVGAPVFALLLRQTRRP